MSSRTLGVAATGLVVAALVLAVRFGFVELAAAAVGILLLSLALVSLAWRRARRDRAALAAALETEQGRVRNLREQAWQSTLLSQLVEVLRAGADDDDRWQAASTALGRALDASRVAAYEKDGRGAFRLRAQFIAEGFSPLDEGSALSPVLVTDRELAARIASSDLQMEDDSELRALAGPVPPRSLLVVPVDRGGRDHAAFAIHYCETPKSWTEGERRFVQRVAEHVSSSLEENDRWRKLVSDEETSSGLLRFAQALASVRDRSSVAGMAVAVGAPLLRARRSAVLIEDECGGFEIAAECGFGSASPLSMSALKPRLDQALRERALVRTEAFDGAGALALVPMFDGREPIGALVLECGLGEESVDAGAAQVMADLVAAGLENARTLERLASSEASYEALSEAGPDLCFSIDPRGILCDANPAACRLLGFSRIELLGLRLESLLVGESASVWRDRERELFRSGRLDERPLKLRSKDGGVVEVVAIGAAIGSAASPRLRARLRMRDVSEIRALEQQLRQSQKLELIGELAGGIAHDFNNVLGGILGYASLLRTYLKDRTVAARYVETIERSAVRGAELTGRLLSASRNAPTRREPVNLNLVVEETLELLAHSFHKRIRIERRLDPAVRSMMADSSQLQQVVLNLCVNARDAMPKGGVLGVTTRLLEPEAPEKQRKVQLIVEDTGVGMDSNTLARLFEPFFSTKGEGGTGLGLSVVYGIVKSLGGDIGVRSSPGRGARFEVVLPADLVEASESYLDSDEPAPGRGELILIVDDEKVLRELGKDILEGHGYRVATVSSGEEALDFLEAERAVALVILDVVMPGMGGTETFRRLRVRDRGLPVLLSSGLTAEESVIDILQEGAAGFIPKPYGISDLTRAVDFALRQRNETLVH
jgi:PAS domain S-box-containing protein